MTALLHATAVAIGEQGVLLTGPSGAGKSDLALRLIDRGAVLVSDDQVALRSEGGRLLAAAPATIAGRMEVRGVGIIAMPRRSSIAVALIVDLAAEPVRMPEPSTRMLCGHVLPLMALAPFAASAPLKIELALRALGSAE